MSLILFEVSCLRYFPSVNALPKVDVGPSLQKQTEASSLWREICLKMVTNVYYKIHDSIYESMSVMSYTSLGYSQRLKYTHIHTKYFEYVNKNGFTNAQIMFWMICASNIYKYLQYVYIDIYILCMELFVRHLCSSNCIRRWWPTVTYIPDNIINLLTFGKPWSVICFDP